MSDELGPIEIINMNPPRPCDCFLCGQECGGDNCGVPTFNGDVVSNDWNGEWGSKPVCQECFDKHADGRVPTFDHLYDVPETLWGKIYPEGWSR